MRKTRGSSMTVTHRGGGGGGMKVCYSCGGGRQGREYGSGGNCAVE